MNALSDTLYYALQNLETQMVMQHNMRAGWPCRQIVRAGVDVAGMMLGDDEVEEHRDAYLSLLCKRLSGDPRETIITMIMMAALFNLMPADRQAKRCKATLADNWADDIDDIYHAYCRAIDKQIDCLMEKQPSYTFTVTVMKTEQPQYNQYNNSTVYNAPVSITNNYYAPQPAAAQAEKVTKPEPEDIEPVDTSFFRSDKFSDDIVEKNLREAIDKASSKADACRKIMSLENCGYILLSNVNDARKAELINPFAAPKYVFTGDDFKKARNNPTKLKKA